MTEMVVRAPGVVAGVVDGETVLLAPTDSRCFALTGVADRVWELLAEPIAIDDLVAALVSQYDVEPDRCAAEVGDLIAQMREYGVVGGSAHAG